MTADQFWNDDPWLAAAYREADKLNKQRKSEEMWLQGLYIHEAVGVVVNNALRKKGTAPIKYREEPFRLIPLSVKEQAVKAEEERNKAIAYFNRMAKQWEKRVP